MIDSYFGVTIVTNGKTQSAEHDDSVYHETLVPGAGGALTAGKS